MDNPMETLKPQEDGSNRPLRIGLFGGTFNPVHIGHLRAMVEIREALDLDQLILFPSAIPPHKPYRSVVSASDRMAMLTLALSGHDGFTPSDVELKRDGPSFTIDTVRHYRDVFAPQDVLYLIMGRDAFMEISTWRDHMTLFRMISMVVMSRPGKNASRNKNTFEAVSAFLKMQISSEYRVMGKKMCLEHPSNPSVFVREVKPLDISSTQIRELIRQGKSVQYLVPDAVAAYIDEQGLYLQ